MIDGEVKIIDEFTGRILEGRRWSDGLHQAVEAKEGVRIREENQTLATITLQNYFRLYDKLSGMTGTALTEATEFMKIYEIPVVEIRHAPADGPRRPQRPDLQDQGRQVEGGRRTRSRERHERGQPMLVGTISVEISEMLSERAQARRDRARGPQREARVRPARGRDGRPGGSPRRGHDRHQHGRPRRRHQARRRPRAARRSTSCASSASRPSDESWEAELAEHTERFKAQTQAEGDKVRELGGLFICGTERHESRRIDNQLRGRSGRQGDPGESRFFLSAEDDLIRLFAGERIYKILDRLGPVDDEGEEYPLEAKMLTRTIENAQKKVEQQNYLIRKRVLEYDDVMNEQRRVVYKYRREILEGRDMSDVAHDELEEVVERTGRDLHAGRDLRGLGPGRARGPRRRPLAAAASRSPSSTRRAPTASRSPRR